jgi:magnesium-protoporphyrin O-methyltransferase
MGCCAHCDGLDKLFDRKNAEADLKTYLRRGPSRSTRALVDALRQLGVSGLSLLDIGGGIGAIHHELFAAGVSHAVDVDASGGYIAVAREEDARRGQLDRVEYRRGDFVALADDVEPADIVTLDRVICCYPDMPALVKLSSERARRYYGLVYPHEAWWTRVGRGVINLWMRFQRNPYRFFVHPTSEVEGILRSNGFERQFIKRFLLWEVALYARSRT